MSGPRVVMVNATGVRSGAENVLGSVAHHVSGSGAEVVLVSPPGRITDAFPPGTRHVPIRPLGLQGRSGWSRLVALVGALVNWVTAGRALRRVTRPDDVVVVNSLFALPALGVAFPGPRRRGLTTWLVHDTVVSAKQRLAVRLGARRLDRAVAVSEVTAESVRPLVRDVIVRVNGVALPDEWREGASPIGVVGILAALTPWKGHDVLLEAIARVPGVRLEIAGAELPGESAYAAALRARAARDDLHGRVDFLGHVDRADVLPRWTVAVSASVLPEAGPLGVLECMAAGVPVVATDHGGAAEYLAGGAGVLVPPGDASALGVALSELLDEPGALAAVSHTARRRVVDRHDIARTLPALVAALTGI
ncbi:glycosyltransferase family 4 protein [Dietzia sp. 179-F 9C3 NHS]|uniref:glycosyltransferase family 4 protein n=1 Tax=Dietzia sp. 179-F 9C3 NHS TaxID=3374295 RepID=UPI0038795D54